MPIPDLPPFPLHQLAAGLLVIAVIEGGVGLYAWFFLQQKGTKDEDN